MALRLRWVGSDELDRVAETRWLCYAHSGKELDRLKEWAQGDSRAVAGDYLLAERDGVAVGTATSLTMTMWVRGAAIACQGVAWVGAIKTARRRSAMAGGGEDRGVATAVMQEVLAEARRRKQVISALMPFRVSFYEHFGYGVMERRAEWTVPLAVLPSGSSDGWRPFKASDIAGITAAHQKIVEAGQCDVERSEKIWAGLPGRLDEAMAFVLPGGDGKSVCAWAVLSHQFADGRDLLRLDNFGNDSTESFLSLLSFIGALRDQYYSVKLTVPVDMQLHRFLKEPQLPHRPVNHPAASMLLKTRLQTRILDHKRFLEALVLPHDANGRVEVAVKETEGDVSRFTLEIDGGRSVVKEGGSGQFECTDRQWAAIACGDLSATQAVKMGLAVESAAGAAVVLDHLGRGNAPFCREHF